MSLKEQADLLPEGIESKDVVELRKSLMRVQKQLSHVKKNNADFTEAIVNAAHDAMLSYGPIPKVVAPKKDTRTKKAEVALLHSTDWQLGKKTLTYDTKECERLVKQSIEKTIQLTNIQRADHPVKKLCIMFGGDIIENTTIFPSQPYEVDSDTMTQFIEAARIMVDIIRMALESFEEVEAFFEEGNHGRIGKLGDLPKHVNWDKLVYLFVAQALKGEKRFISHISDEDIKRVVIGNYKALLIHGDEIRWGTASTIVRFADRWKSGAYKFFDEVDQLTKGFDFRDLYIGHFHQHQSWNMANGEGSVFMSAATESGNRYARDLLASNGVPSQRLHFIDPIKGRVTSEHRLWLD